MMKLHFYIFISCLFVGTLAIAQKQEILFTVIFNGEKVGMLNAQETKSDLKSFKVLTIDTHSSFLFIPIYMESEVTTNHENGILINGTAYRSASRKSSDVIATVKKIGFRMYQRELNGVKDKIKNRGITFCVIDLYFCEPVGITQIFSNMYGQMLTLNRVGIGQYQLVTPDENDSIYTYIDGKLVSVEANTFVGKIISKRV